MPRALAIETSGRIGSIATVNDGQVLREEQFAHGLQNAARILPIIDDLCRAQGWRPRDVDELYVSIGPGSFTGLRVGVTIAKTMAFATGARVVAVPTVEVLARNAPADARHVLIVLDAKRRQIFTARFERRGEAWHEVEPPHLDDVRSALSLAPRPVHLVGEGIPYHLAEIPANDMGIVVTSEDAWRARSGAVAHIGHALARRGAFADVNALAPLYSRLPEAEEKWQQQQGLLS